MFFYRRYLRVSTMDKEPLTANHKSYKNEYTFGLNFFKSLVRLFPLFYPTWEWAFALTFAIMGLNCLSEFLTNKIGRYPGRMYNILLAKDYEEFWDIFVHGTFMYIAKTATLAFITFVSWLLYVAFRRNLVSSLQRRYFRNNIYYRMNCVDGEGIDNPDQRITQDIEKVCNSVAVNILPAFLSGPFVIAYYTYQTYQTAELLGVGIIYGYFIVGTIVNKFLIAPLAKWGARVEKAEGDFRYKHVSIRDNAESSILYKCERFEENECNRFFNILILKQFYLVLWRLPNNFFKQFFDYYGGLLSYALQFIPIIMLGTYDDKPPEKLAEIVSNNAFIYIYLVNSFTRLTDLAIEVGEMAGVFQRIADFVRYSDELARKGSEVEGLANQSFEDHNGSLPVVIDRPVTPIRVSEGLLFEMNNVCYTLPNDDNYLLMNNLNLRLLKGQNLLVTGPSGAGKSSFLRVLMRLWNLKSGMLTYGITSDRILHCPQKAYFPVGRLSLRQQITFPLHLQARENDFRDSGFIEKVLKDLKLYHLVERCGGLDANVEFDWHETLTPGELQRLAFVRLMYHRPLLAILDEATNSVSSDMEQTMYQLLISNDLSFISAGHRQSLEAYHTHELKIDGKTGYSFRELRDDAEKL